MHFSTSLLRLMTAMFLVAGGCSGGGSSPGGGSGGPEPETVRSSMRDCLAPERPQSVFGYRLEPLVEGLELDRPTAVRPHPVEPGEWWAIEQGGRLVAFTEADPTPRVLLDVSGRIVEHENFEIGLLGFAFHPNFPGNPWVYVSFTADPEEPGMVATLYLSAFRFTEDPPAMDPASERVLLRIPLPTEFHHGGTLEFDTADMLLLSLGDGGIGQNGQDVTTLLGSLLRIDVDGHAPYGIPADNPLVSNPVARPEIYAFGFRNLWKYTVDRTTGRIFGGDVGGSRLEEVGPIEAGRDHGWPTWEGTMCRIAPCDPSDVAPLAEYSHEVGRAVVAGPVYRGRDIPDLQGRLLYGDWQNAKVWAIDPEVADSEPELLLEGSESMSSFVEDVRGEVYVLVHRGGDNLRRIVVEQRRGGAELPARLSDTGCVVSGRPEEPAGHLLPYAVNHPFWSDGLGKNRWLSLPPDGQIRVGDDGDWELPVGSVLMKNFRRGSRLLETRLFMHHSEGWAGYTYAWDEEANEAWLQSGSLRIEFDEDSVWTLPTRAQCLGCHTEAAGWTLGLETAQLDGEVFDPATGDLVSQISLWKELALFEDSAAPGLEIDDPIQALEDGTVSSRIRARDYLHVNCSGCHRPDGPGLQHMDFRRKTPFAEMGVCDVEAQIDDDAFAGMLLLKAAQPQESIVVRRLMTTSLRRMPPVGTSVPHQEAIEVLRDWIAGIESCGAGVGVGESRSHGARGWGR